MLIKQLHLEQFKGVFECTYDFGKVTQICGQNAAGKTTIADAIYFLLLGKNYALKDNPDVLNINSVDSSPKVTALIDFGDGKEAVISKWQKVKKSKADDNGVSKTAITNNYSWNEVPIREADFKQKFIDAGFDLDIFSELSHPDVFTKGLGDKKQREHMRETLFKMCSSHSDLEIAKMFSETEKVAELLEKYTFQEIEAIQKSSLKRANEQVSSIPLMIIGMEKTKVDDSNASELELKKRTIEEQIKNLDSKSASTYDVQLLDLEFEKNDILRKANEEKNKQKHDLSNEIADLETILYQGKRNIEKEESLKSDLEKFISLKNNQVKELQEKWKIENAKVFSDVFNESIYQISENQKECSACGQRLPEDQIEKLITESEIRMKKAKEDFDKKRKSFQETKEKNVANIIEEGKEIAKIRDKAKKELSEIDIAAKRSHVTEVEKKIQDKKEKLESIADVDLSDNKEYQEVLKKIKDIEETIESEKSNTETVDNEIEKLNAELEQVINQIAAIARNSDIDEKISDLKEQQIELEQVKADAECILYQLDLLSQKKNLILTDEINKNFKIVKFKLFDFLKNGSYQEVCIPMINGKQLGTSMNTGLEILAKLDICQGLQNFYGISCPIVLDNAESININKIPEMECQLITMRVTDDQKLKVEVI